MAAIGCCVTRLSLLSLPRETLDACYVIFCELTFLIPTSALSIGELRGVSGVYQNAIRNGNRRLCNAVVEDSVRIRLVQSLNSPFFPPHIGAEPWRSGTGLEFDSYNPQNMHNVFRKYVYVYTASDDDDDTLCLWERCTYK